MKESIFAIKVQSDPKEGLGCIILKNIFIGRSIHALAGTCLWVGVLILCSLLLLLPGCSGKERPQPTPLPFDMPVDPPPGSSMLDASMYAGDALSSMLLHRLGSGVGILSTALVNFENMDESSAFGRIVGQQIASRVAQHGFKVMDVRLTETMRINKNGEFMLSRELANLLANTYDANSVIVGGYSRSADKIFITLRTLRIADNAVIAAYEYYLPLSNDTAYLLGESGVKAGVAPENALQRYGFRTPAFPDGVGSVKTSISVEGKDAPAAPTIPNSAGLTGSAGSKKKVDRKGTAMTATAQKDPCADTATPAQGSNLAVFRQPANECGKGAANVGTSPMNAVRAASVVSSPTASSGTDGVSGNAGLPAAIEPLPGGRVVMP